MLEYLRNNFDLGAVAVTAVGGVLLVAIIAEVRKNNGRPARDTVVLVVSGIALILLTLPIVIAFSDHDLSPEWKWLLGVLELLLFLAVAQLVWWCGNKLSHHVRSRATKGRKSRFHQ